MRPSRILIPLALTSITLAAQPPNPAQANPAQDPAKIYAQITRQPSTIHWCFPEAGDDPTHIIANSCETYNECLGAVGIDATIDRPPFAGLSTPQLNWVQHCHQALSNAARTNPQIKGSKATQDWLEHSVYPGTEAKPSPLPQSSPPSR